MKGAARIGDRISGSVSHHAGHIIGYDTVCNDDDCWDVPIYCSGHGVDGQQVTGSSNVFIEGIAAARLGDTGSTNCACDGKGYKNIEASTKVFINGKPAVRIGDKVDIHGHGTGAVVSGSQKVFIG